MDTARTRRYVSVRPLTRTLTARYRVVSSIGVKKREKKKRQKKSENSESDVALPISICRPQAISSPGGEKKCLPVWGEGTRR
ncbi:hypothetical protein GW17_00040886, partial [Ensete ventricosum]